MIDFKIFPNTKDAIIWAIDDAWFTGEQSLDAKLDFAITICADLADLEGKIANKPIIDRNVNYLKAIIEFCLQHDLRLGLGSFEYFQQEFEQIDSRQSAVLLDVRYQIEGEAQWPPESYGVYLLHDILKGNFPKSEIFFMTAYPDNVKELFQKRKKESSWWPLIDRRIMSKRDEDLKNSLNPFFENFANRLKNEDRFRELAGSLIDERKKGDDYTHPLDIEELKTKHQHIPLLSSFLNAEEAAAGSGVASYSALYHTSTAANFTVKRGVYQISTQVFGDHCKYLGMQIDIKEERTFRLPIQPGLVFLLYFCRFVLSLEPPIPTPTLSFITESLKDWAYLSVNLKDNNSAFRASVLGSEEMGRATRWFKRILRGEGKFVFKLAEYEVSAIPWLESIPIKEEKIFPLLVEPAITSESIALKWRC